MGIDCHLNIHQEMAELEKAERQMGRCAEYPRKGKQNPPISAGALYFYIGMAGWCVCPLFFPFSPSTVLGDAF